MFALCAPTFKKARLFHKLLVLLLSISTSASDRMMPFSLIRIAFPVVNVSL